jgi:hypothetical protein
MRGQRGPANFEFYTDLDTFICKNLDTALLTFPGVSRAFRIESSAISHTR